MSPDDRELQQLRNRWSDGKYKAVVEALASVLPQEKWMDMCDAIVHPLDKKLANDLRGIGLSGRDLKNLDLGSSLLDFANFDGSEFSEAHFQWSILTGASFRFCKFSLAQMIPIFGEKIDFSSSEFNSSYIDHAQIERCNFSRVVMRGGNVNQSKLLGGDFSGVFAYKTEFRWNDGQSCNFSRARFIDCDFTGSKLSEGNLSEASFENCDLSGVDFRGANLAGVRFRGGGFWVGPDELMMARTRFDDTPEARRVVATSNTDKQTSVEWCPVVQDMGVSAPSIPRSFLKAIPGEIVPQSGWWISPALQGEQGRRYFHAGEKFPETKMTNWGLVIWSYSPNDEK